MKSYSGRLFDLSFVIAFGVALIFLFTSIVSAAKPVDMEDYVQVEVQSGDTLWEIAVKYDDFHGLSEHRFINWVVEHNDMTGKELFPGDVIHIPVEKGTEVAMVE